MVTQRDGDTTTLRISMKRHELNRQQAFAAAATEGLAAWAGHTERRQQLGAPFHDRPAAAPQHGHPLVADKHASLHAAVLSVSRLEMKMRPWRMDSGSCPAAAAPPPAAGSSVAPGQPPAAASRCCRARLWALAAAAAAGSRPGVGSAPGAAGAHRSSWASGLLWLQTGGAAYV